MDGERLAIPGTSRTRLSALPPGAEGAASIGEQHQAGYGRNSRAASSSKHMLVESRSTSAWLTSKSRPSRCSRIPPPGRPGLFLRDQPDRGGLDPHGQVLADQHDLWPSAARLRAIARIRESLSSLQPGGQQAEVGVVQARCGRFPRRSRPASAGRPARTGREGRPAGAAHCERSSPAPGWLRLPSRSSLTTTRRDEPRHASSNLAANRAGIGEQDRGVQDIGAPISVQHAATLGAGARGVRFATPRPG
jgi:hypothetical protein